MFGGAGEGSKLGGMTVLRGYSTLEQAFLAKSRLESEGVAAEVLDEAMAVSAPHLLMTSGIRLSVADEDAERAREILGLPSGPPPRKPSGPTPLWIAGAVMIAAVTVLFFGLRNYSQGPGGEVVERDRNGDGKVDERFEYDVKGRALRAFEDNNFDGRWDARFDYKGEVPVRGEVDLDFDGVFDAVLECKNGVVVSETVRPGGEGYPLLRREYRDGVPRRMWLDEDRDGSWDVRVEFDAMGREMEKVPVR